MVFGFLNGIDSGRGTVVRLIKIHLACANVFSIFYLVDSSSLTGGKFVAFWIAQLFFPQIFPCYSHSFVLFSALVATKNVSSDNNQERSSFLSVNTCFHAAELYRAESSSEREALCSCVIAKSEGWVVVMETSIFLQQQCFGNIRPVLQWFSFLHPLPTNQSIGIYLYSAFKNDTGWQRCFAHPKYKTIFTHIQ